MRKAPALLSIIVAAGVCLGLVLLVWVAFTGPSGLVTGGVRLHVVPPTPLATSTSTSGALLAQREAAGQGASHGAFWLTEVLEVLVLLALGWGLWSLGPRVARTVSGWIVRPTEPVEIEPPGAVDLADRIVATHQKQLALLAEGAPRNGIVRCWMLLQETASDLGVAAWPTETATEFLVRMLHQLDVDPRPAARLADLYHVARFSSHPLTESDREAARQALLDLHGELGIALDLSEVGK